MRTYRLLRTHANGSPFRFQIQAGTGGLSRTHVNVGPAGMFSSLKSLN